jgi:hypothetical protein
MWCVDPILLALPLLPLLNLTMSEVARNLSIFLSTDLDRNGRNLLMSLRLWDVVPKCVIELGCTYSGDNGLMYRSCAVKWFRGRNLECDVCEQYCFSIQFLHLLHANLLTRRDINTLTNNEKEVVKWLQSKNHGQA